MASRSVRTLILIGAALALALAFPWILSGVSTLGFRIPSLDRGLSYLTGIATALVLGLTLFFWPVSRQDRSVLAKLWLIRCAVTLGFMLFYEYKYGLDSYFYFSLSQKQSFDPEWMGWGEGTGNIAAFLWMLENWVIRTESFHSMKVLFSLFGLIGIAFLYRSLVYYLGRELPQVLWILGVFPSILFWSSILGKDPVVFLGICIFTGGTLRLFADGKLKHLMYLGVGAVLILLIRAWILPMLVLPYLAAGIVKIRSMRVRVVVFLLFSLVGLLSMQRFSGKFIEQQSAELSATASQVSRAWQRGGSAGSVPEISSFGSMLKFLPVGAFAAVFRPLPGEVMNVFGLMSGFENVFLLYLVVQAYRHRRRGLFSREPLLVWAMGYILAWSMVYAFISPQNLGSAVRFKLQIWPVLLLLLLYLSRPEGFVRNAKPMLEESRS